MKKHKKIQNALGLKFTLHKMEVNDVILKIPWNREVSN